MREQNEQGPFVTALECREFASLLGRKYASFMKDRYFEVETERDVGGIYAKVTLRNRSGSFCYPVEGRMRHVDHALTARDAGLFLIDYIDAYFDEYLREGGEVYLPIDWADYECDGVPLQLKGQILNLEIERLADLWLEGKINQLPDDLKRH
jgi:hypothetical protein